LLIIWGQTTSQEVFKFSIIGPNSYSKVGLNAICEPITMVNQSDI
jgi:hypothetical protein